MNGKLVSNAVSCLGLVFIFVILIGSAAAEVTFLNKWGSWGGIGDGKFFVLEDVVLSHTGQVYAIDSALERIQRFDADGNYQLQWGRQGSDDGEFFRPIGITLSDAGQVYVADTLNDRIQRFDADGNYETKWGSSGSGKGHFDDPSAIALSDTGQVYVADRNNHRILRFDADGNYQLQWGSNGSGDGKFESPRGIALSDTGQVYVADRNNHRIQRFFDSEAWVSGTNTFVNGAAGPTSVAVGPGDILGTSLTLDASKGLVVGDTTTVNTGGTLSVSGGSLATPTLLLDGGTITSPDLPGIGTLQFTSGTLNLTGPSGLTIGPGELLGSLVTVGNGQTLNVTSATTVESGSRITVLGGFSSTLLKIESGGQFDAPSGYTNNDEIQMTGSEAWIMGATLTNNGFISGQGRINASLTNNGQVNVSTGTLSFGSSVANNASGFISGQGTSIIRFDGGLANSGSVLLSFASSTVFGNIKNNPGGMVSLAGNSTATFVGNMVNDGTIYVGSGSHAVFGGDTSGSGDFLGSGTVEFVDSFSPGSSPAEIHFGGDVLLGSSAEVEIELGGLIPGDAPRSVEHRRYGQFGRHVGPGNSNTLYQSRHARYG